MAPEAAVPTAGGTMHARSAGRLGTAEGCARKAYPDHNNEPTLVPFSFFLPQIPQVVRLTTGGADKSDARTGRRCREKRRLPAGGHRDPAGTRSGNDVSIHPAFRWQSRYGSLCLSRIEPIPETLLDADHPARLFHCFWEALARAPLPKRDELDPRRFPALLKWFMILEREPAAGAGGKEDATERPAVDYRVRLHGTAAAEMMYGDLTGRRLSDFCQGECLRSRLAAMETTLREARPVFGRSAVTAPGKATVEVSLGMFPFAGRRDDRPQILVVGAPTDRLLRQRL